MALIKQYRIYRRDLQSNPNVLYLFGDNVHRSGYGGQAGEMRDEPNAIGIATCQFSPHPWRAKDFKTQIQIINKDLDPVWAALKAKRLVVLPEEGLGTGIAQLETRSPYTFHYLETILAFMAAKYPVK